MIELVGLTRTYGPLTAVHPLDLRVERGEIVGLLGHNGAGKSTVMKMITGSLEPTAGTVRVDELELGRSAREQQAIQARIGYLPENCPVWPDMTVIDFLDYQAAVHRVPPGRRRQAVADAIRRTALASKADVAIHTLSRGYRQRVGVAQALLHRPDIVILDEPTNGLDPTQILHMRELIAELAEHATVILSTHILQEVQAVCRRVVILRQGHKVVDTDMQALQSQSGLSLTVGGDEAAVRPLLQALPGVSVLRAEPLGDGSTRYHLQAAPGLAPAVASAVCGAGLALHTLSRERRDLETLFAEVERGSPAAAPELRHAA